MTQKKYQTLQAKNLRAAKRIYEYLKVYKVMDEKTFAALYKNWSPDMAHEPDLYLFDGSYSNRVKTTKQFLEDHELATFQLINGIRVIAATQKCWRTKSFENATKETQIVTNSDIDQAIQYIILNDGKVPAEFEGPIVANLLKLEGKTWKRFVDSYKYQDEWNSIHEWNHKNTRPYGLPIKYKVIGVVMTMAGQGFIKKI